VHEIGRSGISAGQASQQHSCGPMLEEFVTAIGLGTRRPPGVLDW
jgi:hypothetical protein